MPRPEIALLVTDIDNTLYDWVRGWAAGVRPMIAALAARLGGDDEAERRVRAVHQHWGATECPACLEAIVDDDALRREIVSTSERAFADARPVFESVAETLSRVRDSGARVVAYTESPASFAWRRLQILGLADRIDALYARAEQACWTPADARTGDRRVHAVQVSRDRLKPHPEVLQTIAREAGIPPDRVACVGDNLVKDVLMAQRAGVHAVWARYGTARHEEDERLLARLCHWTPEQAAHEARECASVSPGVAVSRLSELFDHFAFTRHAHHARHARHG